NDPSVTIQFDSDTKAAEKQRKMAYADAAKNGYLVGASHLAFPGLGHLSKGGGNGYTWVPLNYSSLK
ncbi:MAG: MBL fold metallo-hydrolase, partial [Bdellovibrionales bacterium]|nr:MBL fold metallo-hydrolase [Ramlibacter sp.]